ncbi:MAG: DUF512 domain-containing protein [Lachnospiraceae bacterium]|nr:DUF512 domain-containing protein [Lachnospiraceae bacterium]
MFEHNGHKILSVLPDSIADQLGVQAGDRLISIDGKIIEDILDYRLLINSEKMLMLIEKPDGQQWELDIEHDYEDPGLEFGDGLMSEYRRCMNNCIFCFIDQMPKGMRETLYFKDDDSRLSFLQGNYVTLTNMNDHDIDRIINYRLSPINVSVHTTNPELRCRMLNNRFAGESLRYIDKLYEAGIVMNGQIVLCPGWNDGEELRSSIEDMLKWAPVMESVSIVPVGMTRYREGLTRIDPVDKKVAEQTIDTVEYFQSVAMEKHNIHFVHASDEFYLLAGRNLPSEETYDGYLQLENGVGMLRLFIEESNDALTDYTVNTSLGEISIATGKLAFSVLAEVINKVKSICPNKRVHLYEIRNDFFGESITVSGLITGQDIIRQLKGRPLGTKLYLPVNMFRSGEEVFLDDTTREDVEKELGVCTCIQEASGYDFVKDIVNS